MITRTHVLISVEIVSVCAAQTSRVNCTYALEEKKWIEKKGR